METTHRKFTLEGKALTTVEPLADGDLIIEGYAATFDGVDRMNENFTNGAFGRAVESFMRGNSPTLCFHHHHDQVLGRVLDLREIEGKGLMMKARVDGAIKDHPTLGTIYWQIRNGTLSGLSVGGYFKRVMTAAGWRIGDMDMVEISVSGAPVHTGPRFAVVEGKALDLDRAIDRAFAEAAGTALDLVELRLDVAALRR